MKILNSKQIREGDAFTISNEPISSVDLMERASARCTEWIMDTYDSSFSFCFFCGIGNNGGDGLAIARMLSKNGYQTKVYTIGFSENKSEDFSINEKRYLDLGLDISQLTDTYNTLDEIKTNTVIVDAIFGSGLSRPIEGFVGSIINIINSFANEVIAIDIPSGLFSDDNSENPREFIIKADYTLVFELPKLSFLFPENDNYVGEWTALPIGISKAYKDVQESSKYLIDSEMIRSMYQKPKKFSHKGTFGHLLVVSGSKGKMGATALCAKASLRSGAGLVTCLVPNGGNAIVQVTVPESMCVLNEGKRYLTGVLHFNKHSHVAAGPGLGRSPETASLLKDVIKKTISPMVIDADALNLISEEPELLEELPELTILTPHPKEFERLVGKWKTDEERLEKQLNLSKKFSLIVVLKGAHTSITLPNGDCYFNSTGNPGMATAGCGDVLTGIIAGLVTRGYTPKNASLMGVYLHGLSADIALQKQSLESLNAGDIIEHLGTAFKRIQN